MACRSSTTIDTGHSPKRRKTRKGTRSCWECKRRKVKCTYPSPADEVCVGCARRCLNCVGQEFMEQDPGPSSKSRLVGDRIGRLESMIQQLSEQVDGHVSSSSPSASASFRIPVPPSKTPSKHRTLSQELSSAYPSAQDIRVIGIIGENLALYLVQGFMVPSYLLENEVALESKKLWGVQRQQQPYTAETHPVLIARQMLQLAIVLQHLYQAQFARSSSYEHLGDLSRPPLALARELAEAALTLVTAHDRLTTGTLEGIKCLWIETMYHENNGSLRQSWLTCRRAISAAHLMGLHKRWQTPTGPLISISQRPNGKVADMQQMWLRLVHTELALSLALEMPPSASYADDTFASMADSATGEDDSTRTTTLERRHATIASYLLRRRERDPNFEDFDATRQIRTKLDEARSAMPSSWWNTSSLVDHPWAEANDDKHVFDYMMKLRAQIFHFHLAILAEFPCMLQAACAEPITTPNSLHHHDNNRNRNHIHILDSSRNICVESSRDLLRRFIHLRSCERTVGFFRLLDRYAWQAVAVLLLAHLLDGDQILAAVTSLEGSDHHEQHLSDRIIASKAMEGMQFAEDEEVEDDRDEDLYCYPTPAAKSGTKDLLLRLLELGKAGTTVVAAYLKPGGAFIPLNSRFMAEHNQNTLVLSIPFVGVVSITPQGQHAKALERRLPLFSGTMGNFRSVLHDDDEAGPHGFEGGGEEEADEDGDDDDDEASLMRAMKLRRSARWSIAPYMLRPV